MERAAEANRIGCLAAGTVQSILSKEPTLNQLAKIDGFFEDGVLMGADKKERDKTYRRLIDYLEKNELLKQTP